MKKHMNQFQMVGLASLVMLGLLFIHIGLGGAKASAESNVKSAISNSQSTSQTLTQLSGRPWVNWGAGYDLPTVYTGAAGLKQVLERGLAQPLALASADFDEDGVPDLVSGYAGPSGGLVTLHRGNVSALWPRSQKSEVRSQKSDSNEESTFDPRFSILDPQPFHPEARVFEVPEAPEFLGAGDFDNDGHWDVVAVARGSDALYLLPGDGRGGFAVAKPIPLPGAVTTLVTGEINRRDGLTDVVVGIVGADGPQVLVFESPKGALRNDERGTMNDELKTSSLSVHHSSFIVHHSPETFPLPAAATALALGQLDNSYEMDLAVAAGSELMIVHGRDRKLSLDAIRQAEVPPAIVEQRSFPFAITSLALGDFVWDEAHQTDIAVLADDGAVHVLTNPTRWVGTAGTHREAPLQRSVRASVPGRLPSVDVKRRYLESRPLAMWPSEILTSSDQRRATSNQLVRAKVSSLPTDDLLVLDSANHKLHILTTDVTQRTKNKEQITNNTVASLDAAAVAVLPMRLNADALNDLVILKGGQSTPTVALTAPMATFTVNSNDDVDDGTCDATHCSLREAMNAANANPGPDTINFSIGSGVQTIIPTSDLPTITDPVTIDGYTQPGASENTNPFEAGTNAVLKIELTSGSYIIITAGNSVVRGLVFGG